MSAMESTKFKGVRCRKHPTRRHGVRYDVQYFLRYTLHGERHEEPFGWLSEGKTAELAFAKLTQIKQNIKDGKSVATLREIRQQDKHRRVEKAAAIEAEKKVNITFDQFFESTYKEHRDEKVLVPELSLYQYWIKPVIGNKRFGSIAELDMVKIKKRAVKAGKALRTVEYAYSVIRMVFNEAEKYGVYRGGHPISKAIKKGIKYDNRKTRYLKVEEADVLLAALKARSKQTHDMALLSLYCGLRAGEICGIDWADVNMTDRTLTLRDTKNRTTRIVPMPDQVMVMFAGYIMGTGNHPVFVGAKGERIKKISKTFPRTVADLEFNKKITDRRQRVVFHTLRHTFASWLVQNAMPLLTVQKLLGHSTIRMTERYSHLAPKNFTQAADILSNIGKTTEEPAEDKVVNINGD